MSFFYMIVLYSIHSSWKNQIKFLIEPEEYDEQNWNTYKYWKNYLQVSIDTYELRLNSKENQLGFCVDKLDIT